MSRQAKSKATPILVRTPSAGFARMVHGMAMVPPPFLFYIAECIHSSYSYSAVGGKNKVADGVYVEACSWPYLVRAEASIVQRQTRPRWCAL